MNQNLLELNIKYEMKLRLGTIKKLLKTMENNRLKFILQINNQFNNNQNLNHQNALPVREIIG